MTRRSRWRILTSAAVLGSPLAVLIVLCLLVFGREIPSDIANFHPSPFHVEVDQKFFYSIGEALMYSSQIDSGAQILARGRVKSYLVAPNHKMIAIVANGVLSVAGENFQTRRVVPVDSIYRDPKPIGRVFFRDDEFQWSKDSKSLYLIKDEFYTSKGSQLYSSKAELCRYEIETGKLRQVLRPFPAFSYFFGKNSAVYFSVPTDKGDLRLRCFNGESIRDVGSVNAWVIPIEKLAVGFLESPFFSFSQVDFSELRRRGADLVVDKDGKAETLFIGGKAILALTQGQSFKGSFYCGDLYHSTFLPGGRYFLFNVPYCGNYEGQLLIDRITGQYESLPKASQIFFTFNTDTVTGYRITSGGILSH